MLTTFQINDPSLESQWRAIILFGKNSATYKFAFAKSLIELLDNGKSAITLEELADPFLRNILKHLQANDKQGNSSSSTFLNKCRAYLQGDVTHEELLTSTIRLGFVNVIDAFQNINGGIIRDPFYEKNYVEGRKEIILTCNLPKKQLHG